MAQSRKRAAAEGAGVAKGATSAKAAVPAHGPLGQVFGVRHLSPSGAWHLQRFIEAVEPTAVLIEGPADADALLPHLVHAQTKPPVALLAFTKQRPVRSILYPLAAYSPEWIAATMGLRARAHVRFMDLPAATFLALQEQYHEEDAARGAAGGADHDAHPGEGEADAEAGPERAGLDASRETRQYLDDPFEAIAQLAGDVDHDTWWEKHFEHTAEQGAYRAAIFEFGRGLRELRRDAPRREGETLLREAYMRRVIRETIAAGHDPAKIVVVCGAFHAPVLTAETAAMTDAECAAMPALATNHTLMPYSYFRLSAQSGYGAGNHAPGYFQALWEEAAEGTRARLPARYLAEVAGHLRRAGTMRSSAEVIEAVRLAHALASLSGDASAPTLRDLRDAAITVLGHGDRAVIERFLSEVEVGDSLGAVPPGVARTSLQDDFYRLVKALRLEEYLKDKDQKVRGKAGDWLDLREDRFVKSADAALRDRNRSIFLHRLEVLGVGFAKDVTSEDDRAHNTFKEAWLARWTPECEISLVENALRGDTVEIATVRAFREKLGGVDDVAAAAALAHKAIACDLADGMELARAAVQALAVEGAGFVAMARAALEIARAARYQGVTAVDVAPLRPLAGQLFLRAALLAPAAVRCDDTAAREVGHALAHVQSVAAYDDWEALLALDRWYAALDAIADDDAANPYAAGVACALQLERGALPDEVLERRVARRISPGADPAAGAGYFEGLASRNHMALLSRRKLWAALTGFIEALDDDAFRRAVVGLRRAFAGFEPGEVRRIGAILSEVWAGGGREIAQALETRLDDAEARALEAELGDLGDLDL